MLDISTTCTINIKRMKNKFLTSKLLKYFLILLLVTFNNRLLAQNNVVFWGIELDSDIVEDSILLRKKGCVTYRPLYQSTRMFLTDEYPPDYMPRNVVLHFSPKTRKVSEVYVIMVLDKEGSLLNYVINTLCEKYGRPSILTNHDYLFTIRSKRGKRIGEVKVAKDKVDGRLLYAVWTDIKSHKKSSRNKDCYIPDMLVILRSILDENTEKDMSLYITDIEKIACKSDDKNAGIYAIYATSKKGDKFKILSHYDNAVTKRHEEIKIGKWYKLKLELYHRGWTWRIDDEIWFSEIKERDYHGHMIGIEPQKSITDLYVTPSLNGLYYVKDQGR